MQIRDRTTQDELVGDRLRVTTNGNVAGRAWRAYWEETATAAAAADLEEARRFRSTINRR